MKTTRQNPNQLFNDTIIGIIAFCVLIALLSASGCTFFKDSPATAKVTVQYAVAKYAEQSSAEKRAERLDNIRLIASAVQAICEEGETTSLESLRNIVLQKILELDLSPADNLLAIGLVDAIGEQLREKIKSNLLKPDDRLLIATVMTWIIDATITIKP